MDSAAAIDVTAIHALRRKYTAELSDLNRRTQSVRGKLEGLNELLVQLGISTAFPAPTAPAPVATPATTPPAAPVKFTIKETNSTEKPRTFEMSASPVPAADPEIEEIPTSLTEAVVWIVNKHGIGASLTPSDIRNHLSRYGFKTGGNQHNFPVTVLKTLKRLKEQARIQGDKQGHSWTFRSTGKHLI